MQKIKNLSLLSVSTLRFVFLGQTNLEPQIDSRMFSFFFFEENGKIQNNRKWFNAWFSLIVLTATFATGYTLSGRDEKATMGVVFCLCGVFYLMARGAYPKETRKKISRSEFKGRFLSRIREEKLLSRVSHEEIVAALLEKVETIIFASKKRTQKKQLLSIFKLLEEISMESVELSKKITEGLKPHGINPHISKFMVKIDLKTKEKMWEKEKKNEAKLNASN